MCGINGFNYADKELLHRMEKFTQKRGPDANGYYIKDVAKDLAKKNRCIVSFKI